MGRQTGIIDQQFLWKSKWSNAKYIIPAFGMASPEKPNNVTSGSVVKSTRTTRYNFVTKCRNGYEHRPGKLGRRFLDRRNGKLRRAVHSLRNILLLLPTGSDYTISYTVT